VIGLLIALSVDLSSMLASILLSKARLENEKSVAKKPNPKAVLIPYIWQW
jgi:hypothetical protein